MDKNNAIMTAIAVLGEKIAKLESDLYCKDVSIELLEKENARLTELLTKEVNNEDN